MDQAAFHKLRLAVQENAHPAEALHARQLKRFVESALEESGLFAEVELGRTDDVDRLVIGVCRCAADVLPWEAGMALERIWMTAVVDARWEAHAVACTESIMEFEGAFTVDDSGSYVTLQVVAEPPLVAAPSPTTTTGAVNGADAAGARA
ncbi:hypothetical protein GCM10027517_32140 [Phycicoccus ginsengisoli]